MQKFRVIYRSEATRPLKQSEITALSIVCRRKNAATGLTGLLLFHEGRFLQVLEGDGDAMMSAMVRIVRDRRHRAIQLITTEPIAQRAFTTFRIGFDLPDDVSRVPVGAFELADLIPPDSDFRGRDATVREHVRAFLASFRTLPARAGA